MLFERPRTEREGAILLAGILMNLKHMEKRKGTSDYYCGYRAAAAEILNDVEKEWWAMTRYDKQEVCGDE